MEWHNLPKQLIELDQWVCADDSKQPRNANTGDFAKVDDPLTWASFQQACKAAVANCWDIGFILSNDDEFTIVDLDDKPENPAPPPMRQVHADILRNSDTYIERSVSGTGYHVIMIGEAPKPIKTPWIEMYSSHRLMVCTGDIVKDLPLADGTPLINKIDEHFGSQSTYVDPMGELPDQAEGETELSDEEVLDRCRHAENADKFEMLWSGDISGHRNDHSAADSALLNLLCFMTPHNEQVRRLFKQSKLYRPSQRNRQNSYMNRSIVKWRAENPPIDMSLYSLDILEQAVGQSFQSAPEIVADEVHTAPVLSLVPKAPLPVPNIKVPSAPAPEVPKAPASGGIEFPPGIIGDIARYSMAVSYNPVPEGSLSAAIAYCCGLLARGFHVNGLGLNQYVVFIADSGVGKEGGKKAVRALHNEVYAKVPSAQNFLGSADFSAGVTLVKELAETPSMLGIIGEIGLTLKTMVDPRAPSHVRELKRALTDAWSESGPTGRLLSRKYSDKSKNSSDATRPALSLLGESVPSHFYGALSVEAANDGFIPRWIVLEYPGERPYPNRAPNTQPPAALVERLQDLFVVSKTNQDSNVMTGVGFTPEAWESFMQYEDSIIVRVNDLPKEHPVKAILNRTNEKALKLAALLAVCENPHKPIISIVQARWAQQFVATADGNMIRKFDQGEIGDGEEVYSSHVRNAVRAYQKMTHQQKLTNKCPKCALDHPVVPHAYMHDYLKRRTEIKNHRNGMNVGVKVAIEEAIMTGVLVKLPPTERMKIGLRSDAYLLGESW